MNNAGDVALSRWDTENANNGLWVIRDGKLLQITDGAFGGTVCQINNRGEVAWESANFPSYNIALLTKPEFVADLDFDADVDLRDFAIVQGCLGSEGVGGDECRWADLDHDDDVDKEDYARWVQWLGGPE